MKLHKTVFLLMVFCFVSCTTTGVLIKETPSAVSDIRKAFVMTFGQPRMISSNGRELYTQFHEEDFITSEVTDSTKVRRYTKVIILGERRPYDIEIDVIKERRVDGNTFEIVQHEEALSLRQAKRLKETLDKSRVESKSIDEFTPF